MSPKRITAIAIGTCFLLGAVLGWRQIVSPDIGFHLSSARWILENRAWPDTDLFSYTFTDHPYVDLQWLFQLVLYAANAIGGTGGMIALKILLTLTFWAFLVMRTRRAAGALPSTIPVLLVLVALGDYWEERPHLFSWVLTSLVLLVLEEWSRGNRRWLPALPIIMVVWVNSHQMFALGPVIIAVYALWELRRGRQADRGLLAWSAAALAACLVNPYHIRGFLLPLTLFGEIQSDHLFTDPMHGFAELQGPFDLSLYFLAGRFVLFQGPFYWHLYALVCAIGVAGAWRRMRVPDVVLWVLFTWVFALAHKNFGYFVAVTFPIAAIGTERVWIALRDSTRRPSRASGAGTAAVAPAWIAVGLVLVLVPLTMTGRLYRLAWTEFPISSGFNSRFLPVEAGEFLRNEKVQGRVVTPLGFGSYVHWATRLPVNIYGIQEVFGPHFYREYLSSLTPVGFPAFLTRWRPTIAVVSFRESPYWTFYLSGQSTWRLVHYTDTSAVFLHETIPGPKAVREPVPNADYAPHTREAFKRALADAAAKPDMSWSAWWQGSSAVQQPTVRRATFYLHMGWLGPAANVALDGLVASPVRLMELLMVVGNAFNALGDYEIADQAYNGALQSQHADTAVREQVQAARDSRRPSR